MGGQKGDAGDVEDEISILVESWRRLLLRRSSFDAYLVYQSRPLPDESGGFRLEIHI